MPVRMGPFFTFLYSLFDVPCMAAKPFKIQFVESMNALIISAFGLVAALAWNEAIKAAVKEVFGESDNLVGMLIYAILVTILAVAMTMLISWVSGRTKEKMGYSDDE